MANGIEETPRLGYGWDVLPSGLKLDRRIRRLYRKALVGHEDDELTAPPNPFDASNPGAFVEWLNQPASGGPRLVSRFLLAIYNDRPDLQRAFPNLFSDDAEQYVSWIRRDGVVQEKIPPVLMPSTSKGPAHTFAAESELKPGANVAGYSERRTGNR